MAHLILYLKSSGTFTGCWSLINSLHIRLIYIINKIDHGKVSWRLYILRYVIIIFCEFTRFLNRNQCHLINLKPSSPFPIIGISWSQSKMLVLNQRKSKWMHCHICLQTHVCTGMTTTLYNLCSGIEALAFSGYVALLGDPIQIFFPEICGWHRNTSYICIPTFTVNF